MEICGDHWLSAIFGYRVFKIDTSLNGHPPFFLNDSISRHVHQQSAAMYYAKIETNEVETVRQLGQAGFYVVDVNVTFGRDPLSPPISPSEPLKVLIDEMQPDQHQAALDIAASCFKFSRFHLDPFISEKIANQIKHDWILSYIQKQRGERLFVALREQQPVGFLAALSSVTQGKRVRIIDLIGVDKRFQNQGVGKALVTFFINYYKDQSDLLQVGTQVANVPSIRLYQKLGFSIVKTQYVMHLHVQDGIKEANRSESRCE